MKESKHFKNLNPIQKIGVVLIIIAGIAIILRLLKIFPRDYYTINDLPNYLYMAGFALLILPKFLKSKSKNVTTILLLSLMTTGLYSQDYSKQIDAFTKSFSDKNTEAIQPFLSAELKFGKIPEANTPEIINNIVKNLPKLNSMTIVESERGKAKVVYDFVGFGKSESFIHFDADGKITRILLVEDLINQEAEARRQQKVPLPTPGALGDKYTPSKVEFLAPDELIISGNLYEISAENPIILLLHQAGYNRMEYADIAPKLNEMGYNCLVIDLRSGGDFAGKSNNTNQRAIEKGLRPEMVDAQQDIAVAIDFLNDKYKKKVIIWGSSFSSSLAILEGVNNSKVKAIIGFSPGDYFGDAAPSLKTTFEKAEKPFLVTSSKGEAPALSTLIGDKKMKANQSQFVPTSNGFHGSRALWEGQEGADEYWDVVRTFLRNLK